jgi:hypothetical protein
MKPTTIFPLTSSLHGCIYSLPNSISIVLDFIDSHGAWVADSGLTVYDRYISGSGICDPVECFDAVDLVTLNPYHMVEIVDGNDQRLHVITFSFLDRLTSKYPVPVILTGLV